MKCVLVAVAAGALAGSVTPATAATLVVFPRGCTVADETCSLVGNLRTGITDDDGDEDGEGDGPDSGGITTPDLFNGFGGLFYLDTNIPDTNSSEGSPNEELSEPDPDIFGQCGSDFSDIVVFELLKQGVTLIPGNFPFEDPLCDHTTETSFAGDDGPFGGGFPGNETTFGALISGEDFTPDDDIQGLAPEQTVVPEPASIVLTGSGLLALLRARRRLR